jgi:hypothetical protein
VTMTRRCRQLVVTFHLKKKKTLLKLKT